MNIRSSKYTVPLLMLGLFILAAFLRLYHLGTLPSSMHEDEILTGYVGRFILLNGRDLYNNPWPLLYFNKFGDFYIILPMYLKGLATFIFGVNAFAVRFPSAILGALSIYPVYYLAKEAFNNKKVGLLSAFVLAITPWHIVMSRASAEGVMGSAILLTAIMMLVAGLKKNNRYLIIGSVPVFFLTFFIYHPYRIITPLALLPIPLLFPQIRSSKKNIAIMSVFIIAAFALTLYISSTPWGKGRFEQTSIFGGLSGVSIKIQELIYDEGTAHTVTARIFHNKIVGYGREFLGQYLSYFSPQFLFIEGGMSYAYRVPQQGLYYISFIGLLIALFIPFTTQVKERKKGYVIVYILYLLLISVLPSAMTVLDTPNVHRAVMMSSILAIIFGYGLYRTTEIKYKKIPLTVVFIFLIMIEFTYFWHQYAQHADFFNGLYRNDAQKEVIEYLTKNTTDDQTIYMPVQKTMPLYYLFYRNDFNPKYAIAFALDIRTDQLNNVKFMDYDCPSMKLDNNSLPDNAIVVDSHNCQLNPNAYELLYKPTGRNGLLSYHILKPIKSLILSMPTK